jgi:hypothetical protein
MSGDSEQIWQTIRYMLILGGGYLAGRGKIPLESVAPLADGIIEASGLAIAFGSVAWGLYVRFRTVAVSTAAAEVKDVPVVSSATGRTAAPSVPNVIQEKRGG